MRRTPRVLIAAVLITLLAFVLAAPSQAASIDVDSGVAGGIVGLNIGSINALNNLLANSNFLNYLSVLNNLLADTHISAALAGLATG
ncbi:MULTISPECIES: hypothetical protein [Streptomyces]|uniref:Secreted protein n=1 Tax=Streptomyces luteosporeus TaxID=173856 RepID=A0ABN3U819_9ACTN